MLSRVVSRDLGSRELSFGLAGSQTFRRPSKVDTDSGDRGSQLLHTDNTSYGTAAVLLWLFLWFGCNIGTTLMNKTVFTAVHFDYPCILSAVHMAFNSLAAFATLCVTGTKQKLLDKKGARMVFAFSFVFAANIILGNESLRFVSVSFNQVMTSLVPAIVMAIDMARGKRFSFMKTISVLPIVFGVVAATCGDLDFSYRGLFLTIVFVLLAALKSIASSCLLDGEYDLEALDLLSRMAPLSFIWMTLASILSGEAGALYLRWGVVSEKESTLYVVAFSATMSVVLNLTSFMANKVTSALTKAIAGSVKQILLIAISTLVFNVPMTLLNGSGIVVVLTASAQYSLICMREKQGALAKSSRPPSPVSVALSPVSNV